MSNDTQPEIRFPGFTEAWEQRKFKDFTKISQGLQIAISNRFLNEGENRLFYITNEFLNPSSSVKYYIENAPETVIANSDDILMTRTGNTGKVVTNVHGAFHNNFFKIAYDKSKTNKLFLFYLLNSNYIQNEIRIGAGSSTIPDLKHPNFYKINVNTTSLEEQTKIGNFFKSLDDTIALHQRKLDLLKETKKGFLQKMFPKNGAKVPEIRFPGFTEDWEERKLGDMMDVTSVKRIHQSDWTNSGIRFLRARDIVSAAKNEEPSDYLYISEEKYNEYSKISGKVSQEDLLVTGVGSIGVPLLITDDNPIYFKDGNIIWFKNEHKIDGNFFYYSFINNKIQKYIRDVAGIGTVGTYTIDSGKKTPISLPTYDEQIKIGSFFKQFDHTIMLHQHELDLLKETKKGFLQKMFV